MADNLRTQLEELPNDRAIPSGRACAPDGVEPDKQSQAKPLVPIAGAWTPRIVAVWHSWECGRWKAFKTNFYGPWHLSDDGGKTVIFSDEILQEVMRLAQAIEAHRAETGTGSVHESAVRQDAPTPTPENPHD